MTASYADLEAINLVGRIKLVSELTRLNFDRRVSNRVHHALPMRLEPKQKYEHVHRNSHLEITK